MTTKKTLKQPASRAAVLLHPLVRPCGCKYQKEKPWGYQAFRWWKNRWSPVGHSSSPEIAIDIADKYKCILVVCRGCGNRIYCDRQNGQSSGTRDR
jgi:hypothetical protein